MVVTTVSRPWLEAGSGGAHPATQKAASKTIKQDGIDFTTYANAFFKRG